MDKDKAIRSAKLTAAGILDKARARTAVTRAGGQIAPSKYLPNVPRQVHADGGRENGDTGGMNLYRGTNDSGERITGGIGEGLFFGTPHEDVARLYGDQISQFELPSHAKVLTEGSGEFSQVTGRKKGPLLRNLRAGENLRDAANEAIARAKEAGYDAVHFNSMRDMGVAVLNPDILVKKADGGRAVHAGGGNVEGDNGHIYVVHGGSDFDQIDPSYSGRGEPGNIRPLGKGLYGYVLDHTDPESAENAIGWATRYSQKYGGGKKALHVYKIPKSSSTVFNGQREINPNAEGYPKPIKGLGLEPQEKMAAYMAHRATEPPHTDPAWWDWSRKGSALYKDFKDAADLRMEHLPIGLTEVAIQNPKVATRIGKFSLDTPTSDILDAVKGDVQGGNITKAGGGEVVNLGKEKLVRSITKAASDVKSGAHQERMDQRAHKLHESGHLPLPIGTKVTPPQGWDMPSELHIHGYWQDILHPEQHGYKLKSESGDLYEVQHQMHSGQNPYVFGGGFKAYSGPVRNRAGYSDEAMAPRNPTLPTRTPEQSDQLNKEYDQLFGNDLDITKSGGGSVTDSDEFRNWFGNSVTHTDGDPHVFYTGTSKDKDFTSFNVGRHGAWFTRDPAEASEYAERNDSQGHKYDGWKITETNTASRVIPAYVKAENPYTGDLPDEVLRSNYKAAQSDWFDTLRRKGHDAWVPARYNGDLVVALKEPQQIKSIFNNGKFDPNQKHMNKAGGGEVDDDGITAYHGSPHSFDSFDINKIGTGEGAQGYGRGLYFSENPNVARTYQSKVSAMKGIGNPTIDGREINWSNPIEAAAFELHRHGGDREAAASFHENTFSRKSEVPAILRSKVDLPEIQPSGHMYKVKLNVKPSELLDWDKPLSQQHPRVQKLIKEWNDWRPQAEKLPKELFSDSGMEPNGGHIYQHIANIAQPNKGDLYGSDEEGQNFASGELLDLGIKGIRYRDAGSRNDTDGNPTHNYVMFHHDPVQVTDKYEYGGTVGKAGGGRVGKAGGGSMNGEPNDQETQATPARLGDGPQAGGLQDAGGVRGSESVLPAPLSPHGEVDLQGLPKDILIPKLGIKVTAGHNPEIRQVARDYTKQAGIDYSPPTLYKKVDPNLGKRISDAYADMAHFPQHPLVNAAYEAMKRETLEQYRMIQKAGVKMEFYPDVKKDPYHSQPRLMTEDVNNNKHMYVYPTVVGGFGTGKQPKGHENNPLLGDSGERWNGQPVVFNDLFRAVHDYFGHVKEGLGFRGDGEENAWRSHAAMYSPLARIALGAETRGQNSLLNYGPNGEHNRTASPEDTIYSPQKLGVMPVWALHEGAEFIKPEERAQMEAIYRHFGLGPEGFVEPKVQRAPSAFVGQQKMAPTAGMPPSGMFTSKPTLSTGGTVDDDPAPVIQNPMSIFPKPQRMFPEDQRPKGGQYISTHNKADVTGHKAEAATIGIGPNGKPFFQASQNAVDQTGTVGKGSATTKTNLFKQKAGWKWQDAPEGHENTETIVSVEHRGKHFYALNAHFPKGVDLARYENAPSEPRLRPTTQGNVTLGPQAGSISVRGKMHPVYHHVIVKADGGAVDDALALTRRFTKDGKAATMALKPKGK